MISVSRIKLRLGKAKNIGEVGAAQVGAPKVGGTQVGLAEIRALEIGATEIGRLEIRPLEAGAPEIGHPQIGAPKVGGFEIGVAEIGASQVGSMKIDQHQGNSPEILLVQVHMCQIGALAHVPARRDPCVVTFEDGLQFPLREGAKTGLSISERRFCDRANPRFWILAKHATSLYGLVRQRACVATPSRSAMRNDKLFLLENGSRLCAGLRKRSIHDTSYRCKYF